MLRLLPLAVAYWLPARRHVDGKFKTVEAESVGAHGEINPLQRLARPAFIEDPNAPVEAAGTAEAPPMLVKGQVAQATTPERDAGQAYTTPGFSALVMDFEGTITAKSLWQFVGGTGNGTQVPEDGYQKAALRQGDNAAKVAEDPKVKACGLTAEALRGTWVNVHPRYWFGGADDPSLGQSGRDPCGRESAAAAVHEAAIRAVDKNELVEKVFGGQARVDKLGAMFQKVGPGKVWILTHEYRGSVLAAMQKVGLGGALSEAQIIGRDAGPLQLHWFTELNPRRAMRLPEVKPAEAKPGHEDKVIPEDALEPPGDYEKGTVLELQKAPVLQALRGSPGAWPEFSQAYAGLAGKGQDGKVLFVDDTKGYITDTRAADVCDTWWVNGRVDAATNPATAMHKGGLADDEISALAQCGSSACARPPMDPRLVDGGDVVAGAAAGAPTGSCAAAAAVLLAGLLGA